MQGILIEIRTLNKGLNLISENPFPSVILICVESKEDNYLFFCINPSGLFLSLVVSYKLKKFSVIREA